jgi:uncharacterized protein YjbI with pentapeptide repeats
MNTDKPLTREDVERLLQETGSSSKLVLSGCNLEGIDLSGLDLSQASLRNANLSEANLSQIKLDFANLSGADLSYANLYEANLSGADLSGADLSYANLVAAYLSQANLRNVNLNSANLVGAYLSKVDLSEADLSGADLSGADLSGANLGKTDLSEVNPGNFVTNLFRGRINRSSYFVGYLASFMVYFAIVLVYSLIPLAANSLIHINTYLAAIVGVLLVLLAFVVAVLFWISLTIRRFHDIDKSGYYILWLLVPFINIYYWFVLLFEQGTVGPNRYGPLPLPSIHLFSDPTQ